MNDFMFQHHVDLAQQAHQLHVDNHNRFVQEVLARNATSRPMHHDDVYHDIKKIRESVKRDEDRFYRRYGVNPNSPLASRVSGSGPSGSGPSGSGPRKPKSPLHSPRIPSSKKSIGAKGALLGALVGARIRSNYMEAVRRRRLRNAGIAAAVLGGAGIGSTLLNKHKD